jgi:hypothetical protein
MVQKPRSPQSLGGASPPEEYFDQTIEVCQPYSERALTREDAREIAANMVGFFQVLRGWQREEEAQPASLKQNQPPTTEPKRSKTRPLS